MSQTSLLDLGQLDGQGHALYRVAAGANGDLVLCHPDEPLAEGLRDLEPEERLRLAALSIERPALVVEAAGDEGHYVVLIDEPVDLERHVPLGPGDAELLANVEASAQFGRRDDDVLTLTPWSEEDGVVYFDPDEDEFGDAPVVSLDDDGELTWHRGEVSSAMTLIVRAQLRRADRPGDTRFGVLTNPFGECVCIPEGAPVLPHEDVRHQALVGTSGLIDGAISLRDAAQRLRALADRLDAAADHGWDLAHPAVDDLMFAELREGQ